MPIEWTLSTLGECADFFSGGTPRTSNPDYWTGAIPWISGKDLKSFYLSEAQDHITLEAADAGSRIVPAGTILLLVRGMMLHNTVPIGVVTREVAFNQDIKAIRAREHVDQTFLAFRLLSQRSTLLSTVHPAGHGTGVLATDRLKELRLALPKLDEQKRIAKVFQSIESKIEQNRRTGAKLEGLARAVFKAWFVDFEPVKAKAAGATAFPGMPPETFAALPTRLVHSQLGPVPEGWEVTRWGEIASLEYGKGLKGYQEGVGRFQVFGTNGPIGWHTAMLAGGPGIIIGRKGAYRGVHYSTEPFWAIDTAFYLKPKRPFSWKWAYYELLRVDINGMDSGSAIPSTSRVAGSDGT
jgi:type I restriction enzyme S subunit